MEKVRRSIFETNSSSTHAICIPKEKVNSIDSVNNFVLYFNHGEFDWENDTYDSIYSKASYLYQTICDTNNLEMLDTIREWLKEYYIECEFEEIDKTGFVDHSERSYEWLNTVMSSQETLITYLFGGAFIITGNDNDNVFIERMYITENGWNSHILKSEFDEYDVYLKGN